MGGVAGCRGGSQSARDKASPRAAAPTRPEAPPTQLAPKATTIHFRASDGKALQGSYTAAKRPGAPAVVLVHQYQGGPEQWAPLVPVLHQAGYATLAYRSRSDNSLDETFLVKDVIGAVAALRKRPGVDKHRIGLVAASIGATTIAWALGRYPSQDVRGGVGLSAVEGPALINAGAQGRFRPRGLLLIADNREIIKRDRHPGRRGRTRRDEVDSAGERPGVELLSSAAVSTKLLDWLRVKLTAPGKS